MKLIAAILLACAAPAAGLEEVIISGPGAAEAAAAAPAPRVPLHKEAEMSETRKYLDLLLEYGDRIPKEKLEDLGKDAVRFTSALKKALGPEIMAEVALKEKAAEDRRRATAARKLLSDLRSALQVAYGERGGKYPAHPWELVPSRFKLAPALALPGHEASSEVRIIDSKKRYEDLSKAVNDDGGWVYFDNPESEHYGLLLINCEHKDPLGTEFYKY